MTGTATELARHLRDKDDFLVASHYSPDGDAIGSLAAMGWILQDLGKRFTLYNPSGLPSHLQWLETPSPILRELPDPLPAWTIALDCGDKERMGGELAGRVDPERLMVLDHHLGNPGFGFFNWVDTAHSSTGEMVADLARELGIALAGSLGEAIYLAIVTDTGNFTYNATSGRTLRTAAEIVDNGLEPGPFNDRLNNVWSLNRLQLWSEVLGSTELACDGRVGVLRISRELMDRTHTSPQDTDGLINFVRQIQSVDIAISLRENDRGIKFSLRSVGDVNVQPIASSFGGGGHRNASGGNIADSMEAAARQLTRAACTTLEKSSRA